MKKYLFRIWAMVTVLFAAATSCTDDPKVDNLGQVGILQTDLTADGKGQELAINVTSNAYWHLEFTDMEGETVRWITPDNASGIGNAIVTLAVARNRSGAERKAYVKVITDSENAVASIVLTQPGDGTGGGEGYSFPICEMFRVDDMKGFSNGYIDGNDCAFDGGLVITRTGNNDADLKFVCPCHTVPADNTFQRGISSGFWEDGNAWELQIPVKDELSGALRFYFGSRRDNSTGSNPWTFEWSADGENWNKFDGTLSAGASDAVWKSIEFTIPAEKKIAGGKKLMIRMTPSKAEEVGSSSNKTALFQHGICITKAEAAKSTLPAVDKETVVFSWGFDDVTDAPAAYVDLPLGFMTSWHAGAYSLPREMAEIVAVKAGYARPGYIQIGNGDDAKLSYSTGEYTIKVKPQFEAMNISKSDLKLTFLASGYMNAVDKASASDVCITLDEVSGAAADNEGKVEGIENNKFKEFAVYVRNATPDTEITISTTTKTGDTRFFLDDILVRVEGTPERPGADDPVKAGIADIRAMKGAASGTIADNKYIQGRVVAADNVPEGYFAVADENAGIFVKRVGHNLAAGDMAKVVVKDAALATDADGLLLVTPAAADKVQKVEVAAQMPEAKAISVADLKAGTYEAMYVEMPASQVVDGELAKTMSGEVTLELGDQITTYTMKTFASASFAAQNVPQKSGAVKGLAGASQLLPTSVTDLAGMTGTRYGEAVYAIKPISCYLQLLGSGTELDFRNVSYADKTVTFSSPEGCSITKVGGGTADDCKLMVKAKSKNFYDGRFVTKGWGGDNWQQSGLVSKIRATSKLAGNLRFGFGVFAAATSQVPKTWKIVWSSDNTTWNEGVKIVSVPFNAEPADTFGLVGDINKGGYKMAFFNVPEGKAIDEGQSIYIKIMPVDNTCHVADKEVDPAAGELIFQHGFYLSTHEKRAYHSSKLPSGANVLLAEGFDDAFYGHDYFIPAWQYMTNYATPYALPAGWEGTVYEKPGYIRMGASGTADSKITTPALAALGDTPTDITVSFKAATLLVAAAGYVPDDMTIGVTSSGGSVNSENYFPTLPAKATAVDEATALKMEAAYIRWYDCSAKISGATKDTKITITTRGRHYIDDIVVTKD